MRWGKQVKWEMKIEVSVGAAKIAALATQILAQRTTNLAGPTAPNQPQSHDLATTSTP